MTNPGWNHNTWVHRGHNVLEHMSRWTVEILLFGFFCFNLAADFTSCNRAKHYFLACIYLNIYWPPPITHILCLHSWQTVSLPKTQCQTQTTRILGANSVTVTEEDGGLVKTPLMPTVSCVLLSQSASFTCSGTRGFKNPWMHHYCDRAVIHVAFPTMTSQRLKCGKKKGLLLTQREFNSWYRIYLYICRCAPNHKSAATVQQRAAENKKALSVNFF